MEKRLLEIVLKILDRADEDLLEGEEGLAGLEELLRDAGFDRDEIVHALRLTLQGREGSDGSDPDIQVSVQSTTLSREAWDYLERLRRFGLISEEETGEVLHRAADLPSEGVDLESVRFLAASIIFDRASDHGYPDTGAARMH